MCTIPMRTFFRGASLAAFGLAVSFPVPAGCMSDCREEYDAAVEDCRMLHDSPDEADDLRMRIDDAKAEYDDCVEECRS
jgi:hypothetical protein